MKRLYLTIILLLILLQTGQSQATTTLNQTFSSMGAVLVDLDVPPANVTIKTTKGSRIIVESSIKLSVPNERLLQFLVKANRYQLQPKYKAEDQLLLLQQKRPESAVVIRGEEVLEKVHYTLYLPQHTAYAKQPKVAG